MREALFDALFARMARDPRVCFLTADIGLGIVERFHAAYPMRTLNVGVCEQNLIAVAAGLASAGKLPVCYTISNFITERCFEQLRDDIAVHEYPCVLIGLGAGFDNNQLGPTHHMMSDWGVLKNIPNVEVHCPASKQYAARVLDDALDRKAMAYVRLAKSKGWFNSDIECESQVIRSRGAADDTVLVTYGGHVEACLDATRQQESLGLAVLQQLKPIPNGVYEFLQEHKQCVVVEDHFPETGLYASLCQLSCLRASTTYFIRRGPAIYIREAGDTPEHFWKKYKGDAASLAADFE